MNKKIKLLFATHLFYPAVGGVEIHLKHLTEGLVKRGFQVDIGGFPRHFPFFNNYSANLLYKFLE